MNSRKKPFRFGSTDDVKLLREVLSENPWMNDGGWLKVWQAMPFREHVEQRRVRERTNLVLDDFDKNDKINRKRSGTDEDFEELEILMTDLVQLRKDTLLIHKDKLDKKKLQKDDKEKKRQSEEIRNAALEGIKKAKTDAAGDTAVEKQTPNSKKRIHVPDDPVVSCLQEKGRIDAELKREELSLQREKLKFEQERFELEKAERERRMQRDDLLTKFLIEMAKPK